MDNYMESGLYGGYINYLSLAGNKKEYGQYPHNGGYIGTTEKSVPSFHFFARRRWVSKHGAVEFEALL